MAFFFLNISGTRNTRLLVVPLAGADHLEIGFYHLLDEGEEGGLGVVPAQEGLGLGGVAEELLHLGGAVVLGINLDADDASLGVLADLLLGLARPAV